MGEKIGIRALLGVWKIFVQMFLAEVDESGVEKVKRLVYFLLARERNFNMAETGGVEYIRCTFIG